MSYLFWIFLAYSFIGWIGETVYLIVRKGKLVNRGILNLPLTISYGFAGVILTFVYFRQNELHIVFFASVIVATLIQWIAGHIIERVYHKRWWDYSRMPWNLDGYICLYTSILWGVLGVLGKLFLNPFLTRIFRLFPWYIRSVIFTILFVVFIIDLLGTHFASKGLLSKYPGLKESSSKFAGFSIRIAKFLEAGINRRLNNAYKIKEIKIEPKEKLYVFAYGINFYKIYLLFFAGSFLGDIVETVFCRITAGVWMSRSSVVIGPFSMVWGIAMGVATVLLYRYKDREDGFIFLMGTFLGGAYEYLCSVFTELVFGKVFWDYSRLPFNIGGRINLLYCFFWGIAAVIWIKTLYPKLSFLIEKIPVKTGRVLTWVLVVFMAANVALSSAALLRYNERESGIAAKNTADEWLDIHYDNDKMKLIYPNGKSVS